MTPLQRFLRIGRARVQVLEAVPHDPADAARTVAALDALRPERLHVDLTPLEARLVQEAPGTLAPFAARLYPLVAATGPARPNVLYEAVAGWAARAGVPFGLLLPDLRPAPAGTWLRPGGLRLVDRILRKEGFHAADPASAVDRFHLHYVSRVPDLAAWLADRRQAAARGLVGAHVGRAGDAVAVLARPEADPVAAAVHRLLAPRPS